MHSKYAPFFLIVVAAIWGLTFPLIENCMQKEDPFLFVALRFSLAALFLIPYFLKNINKEIFIAGILLGILNCVGYLSQTIGLQSINASRAAFITGTNVILIPFIALFFRTLPLKKQEIISAFICMAGLFILTGSDLSALSIGDGFVFLCAFFVALTILYIDHLSKKELDIYTLTCSQIIATACFAWIPCFFFSTFDFSALKTPYFLSALLYCSFFATILCLGLQTKYQKYLSPQKVALILCLEPLFATVFDFLINDTELKSSIYIGGALILFSILLIELNKEVPLQEKIGEEF